jgi:hypothetical protein
MNKNPKPVYKLLNQIFMKKLFFSGILFMCLHVLLAQYDLMSTMDKVIQLPQSPEVSAFEKYGNTPVNLYTGTPSIGIPLYTLQGHEISVPFSLSYDASGIKVDQIATNVGLGWNLNFGGVVSRKVNHLPDDLSDLIMGGASLHDPIWDLINTQKVVYNHSIQSLEGEYNGEVNHAILLNLYDDYRENTADLQADTFSFNVNGMSGTIIIEYGNEDYPDFIHAYCMENPDIKVEVTRDEPFGTELVNPITSWSITGIDGTKYTFSNPEITWNNYSVDAREYNYEYYSAWYLSDIISANGLDEFHFNYSDPIDWGFTVNRRFRKSTNTKTVRCGIIGDHESDSGFNEYKIKQFYLETVAYNGATVVTTEVAERADLQDQQRIKKLVFKNESEEVVLNANLNNDEYFQESSNQEYNNTYENSRLLLRSVELYRYNDDKPKKYAFKYNGEQSLPSRNCTAVDYWGYYTEGNCSSNTYTKPPLGTWPDVQTSGIDRSPDFDNTRKGTLETISYPTGGRTEYFYELHNGLGLTGDITVGGLRIKKTIDYTDINSISQTKFYLYQDLNQKIQDGTYSISTLSPTFLDNTPYTASAIDQQPLRFWQQSTDYDPTRVGGDGSESCTTYNIYNQFSSNMFEQSPYNVSYSNVSEVVFNNSNFEGTTVTDFYNVEFDIPLIRNQNFVNTEVLNGEIEYNRIYDSNFSLKKETSNEYDVVYVENSKFLDYQGIFPYPNSQNTISGHCLIKSDYNDGFHLYIAEKIFLGIENQGGGVWQCNSAQVDILKDINSYRGFLINRYSNKQHLKRLKKTTTKTYENGQILEDITAYEYHNTETTPNHYLTTKITNKDSKDINQVTEVLYPPDVVGENLYPTQEEAIFNTMTGRNQISSPVFVQNYYNNNLMSTQKMHYSHLGSNNGFDLIKTSSIETSKGTESLETRRVIQEHDEYGNPIRVTIPGAGNDTFYIWGYHGKLMLAEIKNVTGNIPTNVQTLIDTAVNISNNETSQTTENNLKTALQNIRNQTYFAKSQIATYTYDPGIGVTSMTDSKGYVMYYFYDQHNRLEMVKDADNNILGENEYSYRINN